MGPEFCNGFLMFFIFIIELRTVSTDIVSPVSYLHNHPNRHVIDLGELRERLCEYGFETGHLHVYYSSSGGWGDDRLGDGKMIVSIRLILFHGMGRWSPSFLVEERTREISR